MAEPIQKVIDLLDLETIDLNIFRGISTDTESQRVFGGQVVSQALVAANRTVEGRNTHSLKSDFLRPGDPKIPIIYEVDRIRDGRSFTTRRVVAKQRGRAIFSMAVSYQIDEAGFEHHLPMPNVPGPDEAPTPKETWEKLKHKLPDYAKEWYQEGRSIDERPLIPIDPIDPEKREPHQSVWIRAAGSLPDDLALHQCVFAYASDMSLLDTCILPHGVSWMHPNFQSASLDHCIWFHRAFRADQWLLYTHDSPAAHGARGFNRGLVYTQDGTLVASVAQEGLIRMRSEN